MNEKNDRRNPLDDRDRVFVFVFRGSELVVISSNDTEARGQLEKEWAGRKYNEYRTGNGDMEEIIARLPIPPFVGIISDRRRQTVEV